MKQHCNMKLRTKSIFIACAIIIYIIALTVFHSDYEYARYEMIDESIIIIVATILYLLILCILFGITNHIIKVKNAKEAIESPEKDAIFSEPIKEETYISVDNQSNESLSTINNEDSQYIGTGVIGLEKYTDFCQIVGLLTIVSGIMCVVYAAACTGYGAIFIMLAIYLVTGGIGCFILSALLKALITITKAAKLYIDLNKKEEEKI